MPDPSTEAHQDTVPLIHLRIPGPWRSPMEVHEALVRANTGYEIFMTDRPQDVALLHVATGVRFQIDAIEPDDELAGLFADNRRISDEEIAAVASHKVEVVVTGPGGSPHTARAMLAAGAAMIHAGGYGVFIDNSGNTHSPRDWLALAGDHHMGGMYWAFVAVTGSPEEMFSTGMHCLGFRDAELPNPPSREQGGFIMHNFLGYSYQSGATIIDGEAIGGPEGAEFRLHHVPCTRFPADTPFHNPYGVWRLEPIADDES